MKIILRDKEYTFLTGYQNQSKYRIAFHNLAKKIFGISFEDWYKTGYWKEKYIPYTLFDGEKAISNVSVNIMDFDTFGKQERYIQIGTVMTDEEYRHKNLNKFLMEKVLQDWTNKCNFIYLFANNTVLEFYPKFGFSRVREYECFKRIEKNVKSTNLEKLNMDLQTSRNKLYDYAKNSKSFAKLSMNENADLVMFYCTTFLKDNVYYIKSLDVIAIAKFNNNQLHLWDVFTKMEVALDEVIDALIDVKINEVLLGFSPMDEATYELKEILKDDALFIQNGKTKLFDKNKIMFPILSHA